MHHTLRFYTSRRGFTLRFYMFWAKWTKIPLLGQMVRWIANSYGSNMHHAYLLTPAEAESILDIAGGVAVGPCDCRKAFGHCDNPVDTEIVLGPGKTMPRHVREITREEARKILRDSHSRGLIHTILRCRDDFYAICSCCSCCCVPLRLSKQYGIGQGLTRHKDIVQEFKDYQLSHHD